MICEVTILLRQYNSFETKERAGKQAMKCLKARKIASSLASKRLQASSHELLNISRRLRSHHQED
jgi:hypothetical protein